MRQHIIPLDDFRAAALFNPFDHEIRQASARAYASIALQVGDKRLLEDAGRELKTALKVDYTSPDLLIKLIMIDLFLNKDQEAQFYYDQFKRVAKRSSFIQLVKDAHQQPDMPLLANPNGD